MNRNIIILVVFLSWSITTYGDELFANKRLSRLAKRIEQKHPRYSISKRKNEWGEIEHIGLRLFSDTLRKVHPSITYDFLERYLLELNLENGTEHEIVLLQKPVYFVTGNYHTALQIDSTYDYRIEEIEFHKYKSTWSKNGNDVLQMVYDMDYQLLCGCNISELEENFVKRLKRHLLVQLDTLPEKGTYIIAPIINNSVYIDHQKQPHDSLLCRNYIFNTSQPSRSVANLMLADDLPVNVDLRLSINRYDYKTDTLTVALCSFLNFCRAAEGCTPYFAIKHYKRDCYEGLLLFANRDSGFMHMLTVTINHNIIEQKNGVVQGKLLAYIPMHNVKQEYLDLIEYETIQ